MPTVTAVIATIMVNELYGSTAVKYEACLKGRVYSSGICPLTNIRSDVELLPIIVSSGQKTKNLSIGAAATIG